MVRSSQVMERPSWSRKRSSRAKKAPSSPIQTLKSPPKWRSRSRFLVSQPKLTEKTAINQHNRHLNHRTKTSPWPKRSPYCSFTRWNPLKRLPLFSSSHRLSLRPRASKMCWPQPRLPIKTQEETVRCRIMTLEALKCSLMSEKHKLSHLAVQFQKSLPSHLAEEINLVTAKEKRPRKTCKWTILSNKLVKKERTKRLRSSKERQAHSNLSTYLTLNHLSTSPLSTSRSRLRLLECSQPHSTSSANLQLHKGHHPWPQP